MNAHPVFLYQYCKKQDLSTPNLKEYIENREVILSEIIKSAKVSKMKRYIYIYIYIYCKKNLYLYFLSF